MVVAKRQGKEKAQENRTKEGLRTGVRTSGKTPGWPNLHRTGPGRDKHIKRGPKARSLCLSLSPVHWGTLLLVSLDQRALMLRRWIFLLSSK